MALIAGTVTAHARFIKDPLRSAERIDRLPTEVRRAVLAICPEQAQAGQYFATYYHDQINLHFEHLSCKYPITPLCDGSQCLHQVWRLQADHYGLEKTFFSSRGD
jgi:hypothetical protein